MAEAHRCDGVTLEVGIDERRAAQPGRRAAARPADRPLAVSAADGGPRRRRRRDVDGRNDCNHQTDPKKDPGNHVGPSQSEFGLVYRSHVVISDVVQTRIADTL